MTKKSKEAPGIFKRFINFVDTYPLRVLGFILVLGIIFNLIYISKNPPTLTSGENDTWWAIALNLIHGQGYSLCIHVYFPFCEPGRQITAMREPLPVLLFAGVALISKESLWAATFVELIIHISILVAIYFLSKQWSNTRAALLASFLWTIYLPAYGLVPQVSGDLIGSLFVTIGILFTLRARQTNNTRDWVIAGALIGIAALSRSAALIIAVVIVAGQILESWWGKLRFTAIFQPLVIFSVVVLLIITPWLVRNKIALGRAVVGSSLVGYNLYRHNYMLNTDNYLRYVGSDEAWKAVQAKFIIKPERDLHGTENEAQMDQAYTEEGLEVIRKYPVQYLLLSAFRVFPLWFNWGYQAAYGLPVTKSDYVIMLIQAVFLILAVIGLKGNLKRAWPLWGSIGIVSLSYMAIDSQLLYLTIIIPLLLSLSAVGGVKLLEKYLIR
jgi:hypothetical protein